MLNDEPPGWLDAPDEPPEHDDTPPRPHARPNGQASPRGRGRIPPHSLDHEEALLGSMLLSRDAITAARERHVTASDFYAPAHAHIYDAVLRVHDRGDIANPLTVAEELHRAGLLTAIGGRKRLLEIQASTPASAGAGTYAHTVHELAWPRRLIADAERIVERAYAYRTAPDALDQAIAELAGHATSPGEEEDLDEWAAQDLGPALRGELAPIVPDVLHRDDHAAMLYRSQTNGIHGDSGLGKSWVAGIAAAQEIRLMRHVLWINLEDPDSQPTIERLRLLGVEDSQIETYLHYHAPTSAFTGDAVELLVTEALEHHASLLVIDSVGEAFGLEGLDENLDKDVGPWMRRVTRRLAEAGVAVLIIDHATKAADNPLHPSGSKRKRAAVTGASYLVEAPVPLTRDHGGRLQLTCAKDRHGHYKRGEIVAQIDFRYYPDGGLSVKIWPPAPAEKNRGDQRLQVIARAAVRAAKTKGEPLSQRRLVELMRVKAGTDTKRAGIEEAVAAGALRADRGPRGTTVFVYIHDMPKPDQEATE